MSKIYEYICIKVDFIENASIKLNELGKCGWRVVSCVSSARDPHFFAFTLEREIETQ